MQVKGLVRLGPDPPPGPPDPHGGGLPTQLFGKTRSCNVSLSFRNDGKVRCGVMGSSADARSSRDARCAAARSRSWRPHAHHCAWYTGCVCGQQCCGV